MWLCLKLKGLRGARGRVMADMQAGPRESSRGVGEVASRCGFPCPPPDAPEGHPELSNGLFKKAERCLSAWKWLFFGDRRTCSFAAHPWASRGLGNVPERVEEHTASTSPLWQISKCLVNTSWCRSWGSEASTQAGAPRASSTRVIGHSAGERGTPSCTPGISSSWSFGPSSRMFLNVLSSSPHHSLLSSSPPFLPPFLCCRGNSGLG